MTDHRATDTAIDTGDGPAWRVFHLVYLLLFFVGWFWQTPGRADVIAAAIALTVFVPVFFAAYEGSTPRYLVHAGIMEAIAWCLSPFAGVHGVFHVYACVQCAFQRPKRRALLAIGAISLAYALFSVATYSPWYAGGFDLLFGLIIGLSSTAAADGIERERRLRRSQVLERQRATLAERERIAHDLHDLLGQTLTTVALKSDIAARLIDSDPQRAKTEVGEAAAAARKAMQEIRAAVYDMTATSVENEIALARQALAAAGVALDVDADLPPLPPPIGKALGLTIREATTNIVRHSGAHSARIAIARNGNDIHLAVSDDGPGQGELTGDGAGLSSLRRRVGAVGGNIDIQRQGGVRVLVWLPLEAADGSAPA